MNQNNETACPLCGSPPAYVAAPVRHTFDVLRTPDGQLWVDTGTDMAGDIEPWDAVFVCDACRHEYPIVPIPWHEPEVGQ